MTSQLLSDEAIAGIERIIEPLGGLPVSEANRLLSHIRALGEKHDKDVDRFLDYHVADEKEIAALKAALLKAERSLEEMDTLYAGTDRDGVFDFGELGTIKTCEDLARVMDESAARHRTRQSETPKEDEQ